MLAISAGDPKDPKKKSLTLILEPGNLTRLMQGRPIVFNTLEYGLPAIDVYISYTDDKQKMIDHIKREHGIDPMDGGTQQ